MGFFRKREPPRQPSCDHKWQNFDWYLEWEKTSDGNGLYIAKYSIIEPFVCIHCKERMNKVLESRRLSQCTSRQVEDFLEDIRKRYPQIRDRPLVEHAIADMQLVDREYLRIAHMVLGNTPTQGDVPVLSATGKSSEKTSDKNQD